VLLVHGQPSAEVKRHAHRASGIIFVSYRDPKHGHEAFAHHRMEASPILAYHVLGKRVKREQQAVQGIEIQTRPMGRRGNHRTAKHGDRLTLGLASRRRGAAGRRWRRKWLPTGRAERCRQRHVLATVDTKLPQSGATRRAENRALVINVLACSTEPHY